MRQDGLLRLVCTPRDRAIDELLAIEERGHSFLESWDNHYSAPTETHDPGQDPQHGGLISARYGKGTYTYVAYALYRQFSEAVPGAYRFLANLISAGKSADVHAGSK